MEDGNYAPRTVGLTVTPNNPNYLQAELLWLQLAAAGVQHIVISPGSRSTPLARAVVLNTQFTCHVLIDERSAGFFALGIAKATQHPVALVCTSGTAAAHYYPAIIEAAQSGYPLIAVTADRPQHLRNTGAPQTIDQSALYGRYAKMMIDLPLPTADEKAMREMLYWLTAALRAMHSPPFGPIQINVPMDEPLVPIQQDAEACARVFEKLLPEIVAVNAPVQATAALDKTLLEQIDACFCGLIVCGPDAARNEREQTAIHRLARKLGWPLLADACSGLRFAGEPNLPFYDIFLRQAELAQMAPEVVIEFGNYPTSKVLNTYLNRHHAPTFRIQRDGLPRDPDQRAAKIIVTDVASYLDDLYQVTKVSRDSLLLDPFWKASGLLRTTCSLERMPQQTELSFVHAILENLEDNSNLVLASSMPVRYADMLAKPTGKHINVFAQRATNGIDGVLSHAVGIAKSSGRPTFLIIGDLAFLHDLSGLTLVRETPNLKILLLNNNGGGIFNFLPVAEYADSFEQIHVTAHNLDLAAFCAAAQVPCYKLADAQDFESAAQLPAPCVYEAQTDRAVNRMEHEQFVADLVRQLG